MEITSRIQTTIFIVDGLCGCLFTTTETLDKHVLSTTSSGAPSATTKKRTSLAAIWCVWMWLLEVGWLVLDYKFKR
jgi:hypothetical protein